MKRKFMPLRFLILLSGTMAVVIFFVLMEDVKNSDALGAALYGSSFGVLVTAFAYSLLIDTKFIPLLKKQQRLLQDQQDFINKYFDPSKGGDK